MTQTHSFGAKLGPWRALAITLSFASVVTAAIAWSHELAMAKLGFICGAAPGHCWACYAAPVLGLGAVLAATRATPRLARQRAR